MASTDRAILLSFDAEEFDLPCEHGQAIAVEEQMRVGAQGLERTLELLTECGARATFFCTAAFALANETLVRRVMGDSLGHEVASHGYSHSSFSNADLLRSREALERVTGKPVVGFRRARLAATDRGEIAKAGYRYNSSENPTWIPGRYNGFFDRRTPYYTGDLLNIPASVTPLLRFPLFWLSLKNFPLWLNRAAASRVLGHGDALVLYFHPWELCDLSGYAIPRYQKRMDGAAMRERLRLYLAFLGERGRYITYADYAAAHRESKPPVPSGV